VGKRKADGRRSNNYYMRQAKEGSARKGQLDRIYARDLGICQLCKQPCAREDASRDHIKEIVDCTPYEARSEDNMQLAHVWCNNNKSNSPPEKLKLGSIGLAFPELGTIFTHEPD
jgi:5-methylcytosine-specific restriction endonuclease McrA